MVSVVICCYNSAIRLPKTLLHLALQEVADGLNWEVILVDNNSLDNTASIAADLWSEYGYPTSFKVVVEKRAGLSFAREKGIREARYEIVLFCDDDNWLASDYLLVGSSIIRSDKQIGALGGISSLVIEPGCVVPAWFKDNAGAYAVGKQATTSGDVSYRRYLWGAGMLVRKSVLLDFFDVGVESVLTGRLGKVLLAGDDSEVCAWILARGYKLWYTEDLRFQHFMPASRLKKEYFDQMMVGLTGAYWMLTVYWKAIDMLSYKKSVSVVSIVKPITKMLFRRPLSLEEKILIQAAIPRSRFFGTQFCAIIRNLKLITHRLVT